MNDLELYVHIPFCVRKCLYCDFLSAPAGADTKEAYVKALAREIRAQNLEEIRERRVTSLFFGGGTPSLMTGGQIRFLMDEIREVFSLSPDAEITMEANPGTLSCDSLKAYREAGINRLSLGLQSTDDRGLKILGRIHTYADFLESFRLAREAGFDNINVDLISAIPGQHLEDWERDLRRVAELSPEHISAYSLIIEEGTPFAAMDLPLPQEEEEYEMYEQTSRVLESYGYHRYEISNHAKPGRECRHNTGYWTGVDYLGLGLGSSSLLDGVRFRNTRDLSLYLEQSGESELLRRDREILDEEDLKCECMILGLRMQRGVSESDFRERFGEELEDVYGDVLHKYEKTGHLKKKDGRWFFTDPGIHASNYILADFME